MSDITYVKERTQNATATIKGILRLAGDLGGTADAPTVVHISPSVTVGLVSGGTGADLSATGPGLLAQASSGANVTLISTSAGLRGVISDETGTGVLVFATTPTLVTPVLGVATATSINKVAITAPATSATLTIADGKTLTVNDSMTLVGAFTLTLPATGTVALLATANAFTAAQTMTPGSGVGLTVTGASGQNIAAFKTNAAVDALVINSSGAVVNALATGTAFTLATNTGAGTATLALVAATHCFLFIYSSTVARSAMYHISSAAVTLVAGDSASWKTAIDAGPVSNSINAYISGGVIYIQSNRTAGGTAGTYKLIYFG